MGIIEVPDDLLREGFVQVPVKLLKLPDLGLGSKLCYCCLLWYAWKVGYFPGQEALAQEFGSTARSVRNYFTELEQAGLIEIHRPARRGEVMSIRLTPSSEWPDAGGVVGTRDLSPEAKGTSRRKNIPASPETKGTSQRKNIPATQENASRTQRQDLPGVLIDKKEEKVESPTVATPRKRGRPRKVIAEAESATQSKRKASSSGKGKDESKEQAREEGGVFDDLPQHYVMAMLGFARGLLERGREDGLVVEVLQGQGLRKEQAEEVMRILRAR
jgi:hypothetical protein